MSKARDSLMRFSQREEFVPVPLSAYPLDPWADQTVSRIAGRHETLAVNAREEVIEDAFAAISKRAFMAAARRRYFSPEDVAAFGSIFDAALASCGLSRSLTRSRVDRVRDSLVRGTTVVSTREIVSGRGCARPVVLFMAAAPHQLTLVTTPMPLEWRQHLVDRVHMRDPERGDAHMRLANEAVSYEPLMRVLSAVVDIDGGSPELPLPMLGGVARGRILPAALRHMEVISDITLQRSTPIFSSGAFPAPSGKWSPFFGSCRHTWHGATFIGRETIDDRFERYLLDITEAHLEILEIQESYDVDTMYRPVTPAELAAGRRIIEAARLSGHCRVDPEALKASVEAAPAGPVADQAAPWDIDHPAFWRGLEQGRRERPPRVFSMAPGPIRPNEARRRVAWERRCAA